MTDTTDAQDLVNAMKDAPQLIQLVALGDTTAALDLGKRIDRLLSTIARLQGEAEAAEDYQQECHKLRVENIRLQGKIGGLREALKPFAKIANFWQSYGDRAGMIAQPATPIDTEDFTLGDCRNAAALTHSADGGRGE